MTVRAPARAVTEATRKRVSFWIYVFMIPAALLALGFSVYPMVMSWWYSLVDWTGFTEQQDFVGFANYSELMDDPMFWSAFGRSFLFMAIATPARLVLSLIVAIALNNQALKLAPVIRTMFFIPAVTAVAVVGIVMQLVLGSYDGPVNTILMDLSIIDQPLELLSQPDTAMGAVIAVQVWKNFGVTMIFWLAALQTIPKDYLEAAQVDGAGRYQIFTRIIVPLLLPFTIVILILTMKENLHAFGLVQSMTGGGPYFATQLIEVYIFQTAFETDITGGVPRLGYASAAGVLFGALTLVISLVQGLAMKRMVDTRNSLAGRKK